MKIFNDKSNQHINTKLSTRNKIELYK